MKKCLACGGENLLRNENDFQTYITVRPPNRASWKDAVYESVALKAMICTDCGYTHFFSEQPEKLRPLLTMK